MAAKSKNRREGEGAGTQDGHNRALARQDGAEGQDQVGSAAHRDEGEGREEQGAGAQDGHDAAGSRQGRAEAQGEGGGASHRAGDEGAEGTRARAEAVACHFAGLTSARQVGRVVGRSSGRELAEVR